ncbi:hypothetical protein K7X08_017605 [Anisodus acutangulus]|uniref:Pectinesterase inhibitor domain-containing protein n=1 Tax=Anisodus acutangulus TaxID=402998 RepID=A0A9Q1LUG7_9SOLA|nr:hypothetical protein K7X08_017605 [Anisodus acutangulus]
MDLPSANDQENKAARKKTIKRISIIAISSIVFVGCVVAAVVGITLGKNNGNSSGTQSKSFSTAIKAICDRTLYPQSCYNSLGPLAKSDNLKPQDIYKLSVQVAVDELSRASDEFFNLPQLKNISDPMTVKALESCHDLLSLALDNLNESLSIPKKSLFDAFSDLKTRLSAAGTYQQTCIDGFGNMTYAFASIASHNLKNSGEFTSNSLAIIDNIDQSIQNSMDSMNSLGGIGRRRLMDFDGDFPSWMGSKDRKLLQSSKGKILKVDVVVAKDGSGHFRSIGEALEVVPEMSNKRLCKNYSTTVFMHTTMASFIDPKGWLPSVGTTAPDTIFYAEYKNFGPGAVTKNSHLEGIEIEYY